MQKALTIQPPTTPDQWTSRYRLDEIPIPTPGKREILVKIIAVGLNPADWKMPKYDVLIPREYPAIIGQDVAGDVEKVGEEVEGFQKGDRVVFQVQNWHTGGAFQQWVAVTSTVVSKIPENISHDEAATLPLALSTAYSGLYANLPNGIGLTLPSIEEGRGKYSATPIIILGGSSAVGQSVIQLARFSGFSPIIATASLKNTEALLGLGATHVPIIMQALAKVFEAPTPHNDELFKTLYQHLLYGWLEKGIIVPNRVEVVPGGLNGVVAALKRLESNEVSRIRLVAHPQETQPL